MNKILGQSGEDQAANLLVGLGYEIIVRNYRTRFGEIDIVARDGGTLVFVEVKARSSKTYGTAFEAVDNRKLAKLRLIMADFMSAHQITAPVRLSVVAIQGREGPEMVSSVDMSRVDPA